jgi:hypothetical protein
MSANPSHISKYLINIVREYPGPGAVDVDSSPVHIDIPLNILVSLFPPAFA